MAKKQGFNWCIRQHTIHMLGLQEGLPLQDRPLQSSQILYQHEFFQPQSIVFLEGRRPTTINMFYLRHISDEECYIIGMDPKYARPDWMIVTALPGNFF